MSKSLYSNYTDKELDDSSCMIDFDDVYNDYTLNIFSDASMIDDEGCYGAVAVCKDTIIDQAFFTRANTTNNECEIFGIRLALYMALGNIYKYKNINVFSDSLINIRNIKNYKNYEAKPEKDENDDIYTYRLYNHNSKSFIANQYLVNECIVIYKELISKKSSNFKFRFQPGHVYDGIRSYDAIYKNRIKYMNNNIEYYVPTTSYLIYISKYNEYVDNFTRNSLWEMIYRNNPVFYTTPIHYLPNGTPQSYFRKGL